MIPSTRALPERPDLAQLKRQAKELLAAARRGDDDAQQRLAGVAEPQLADAQFALAREYGFASWPRLRAAVSEQLDADRVGHVRRATVANRHLESTTHSPAVFLEAAQRNGWSPGRLPAALVFVFQGGFAHRMQSDPRFVEDPAMAVGNGRYFITVDGPAVAVSCMSPGTAFVQQVENQLALDGADEFVILNTAGGLGDDVQIGDIAVIESAVRDEGISDHYLAPGDTVDADEELTASLTAALTAVQPDVQRRVSWTNPAVFRQTRSEIEHYIAEGVTVVESEIAALFAVCLARHARAGAVVVVTSREPRSADDDQPDWAKLGDTQWRAFEQVVTSLQQRPTRT